MCFRNRTRKGGRAFIDTAVNQVRHDIMPVNDYVLAEPFLHSAAVVFSSWRAKGYEMDTFRNYGISGGQGSELQKDARLPESKTEEIQTGHVDLHWLFPWTSLKKTYPQLWPKIRGVSKSPKCWLTDCMEDHMHAKPTFFV